MNLFKKLFIRLEKTLHILENIILYVASTILVAMTLLITVDTLFRYFLHRPIVGVLEITEYIFMVAIVYFSLSYTSREQGHIRVDFLSRLLPNVMQKVNEIIFNLVATVMFVIIGYLAWNQTTNALRIKQLSTGAIEFPMAPAYMIVVIGCFILSIRLLFETIKKLSAQKLGD